jgi:hypothetical protein
MHHFPRSIRLLTVIILLAGVSLPGRVSLAAPVKAPDAISVSNWALTPPTIDGVVSPNEWAGASSFPIADGSLRGSAYYQNDGTNLYLLLDMTADTQIDPPGTGDSDYFQMAFDANDNLALDPEWDLSYGLSGGSDQFCLAYYLQANQNTACQPPVSTYAVGWGQPFGGAPHRVWEFAIRLSEIGRRAGQRLDIAVKYHSKTPAFTAAAPLGYSGPYNSFYSIRLATRVAYVYQDAAIGDKFAAFLASRHIYPDPVALASARSFDFSSDQAILIGMDTVAGGVWMGDQAAIEAIQAANRRIIGIGLGGYAYFGKIGLSLGSSTGASVVSEDQMKIFSATDPQVLTPYDMLPGPLQLYTNPVPAVAFTQSNLSNQDFNAIGFMQSGGILNLFNASEQKDGHCYHLWSYNGTPDQMTQAGQDLFTNALGEQGCWPKIAYVYHTGSTPDDVAIYNTVLNPRHFLVTDVSTAEAETFDFNSVNTILLADQAGANAGQLWLGSDLSWQRIRDSKRPILGIGQGGLAFYTKLGLAISGPLSMGMSNSQQVTPLNPASRVYQNPFFLWMNSPLTLFSSGVQAYGVYLPNAPALNMLELGRAVGFPNHYPIVSESVHGVCYALWGYSQSSQALTGAGRALLANEIAQPTCAWSMYLPEVTH